MLIMKYLYQTLLIILLVIINVNGIKFFKSVRPLPVLHALPCPDDGDIISGFKAGLMDGYNITIKKSLTVATELRLTFDSEAAVLLGDDAVFTSTGDNVYNIFKLIVIKHSDNITFTIRGHPAPYSPPYITSLKVNGEEICRGANLTYFEDLPVGVTKRINVPDRFCGRRRVLHTGLIVSGYTTKAGDWPWHVALYRKESSTLSYICGGTLISKNFVLTAAHCTTISGVKVLEDILGVFVGKYNLFGSDTTIQELQVHQIIVHDEYNHKNLDNDISLLKLRTEVVFNNYVQPACLWYEDAYDKISYDVSGTVVGWGFDQSDTLSTTLHAADMPVVPNYSCVLSNAIFYSNALRNGKKFCAGYGNGTSACNGDSGGGFHVFVPDIPTSDVKKTPGAWYIRGIVSQSLARQDVPICNPNSYPIFTDIAKYLTWIKNNSN